jgi:hypothetical protein
MKTASFLGLAPLIEAEMPEPTERNYEDKEKISQ